MATRNPPHVTTLILLTAVSTLSLNMFLPSLAQIARTFEAPYAVVSLAVGGYLAVTAVIQLIAGPVSDRLGRRPVLLGAVFVFVLASLGCALAPDVWTFLSFRMLQGAVITGYALSLAIIRDTRSERAAAGLIGYVSMAMAIAPMLGPVLGGVLDAAFGWRASFYLYAMFGGGLLLLCWWDVGETKPPTSMAARAGWSALLRARLFWAYALCSAFSTGAFYIFLTGAPLVAQSVFGVGPAELGVYIGSITAGFITGAFLAGRLASGLSPIRLMLAGRALACAGVAAGLVALLLGPPLPLVFFGGTALVGLGNGLTIPASNAAALSVRPDLAGSAAGMSGALVVAMGAALTSLTGIVLPLGDPALLLLGLMLLASGAGLVAVLAAMRLTPDPAGPRPGCPG